MQRLNVEIKARCSDPERVRTALRGQQARRVGTDHQIDTYFRVSEGRLKLRQGTIENALIYYRRPDVEGPKRSDVTLCRPGPDSGIDEVLGQALGVRTVVDKVREIWFVDNVKVHVDEVEGLGSFIEIEAIDRDGTIGEPELRRQCEMFMNEFGVTSDDLVDRSYADLVGAPSTQKRQSPA